MSTALRRLACAAVLVTAATGLAAPTSAQEPPPTATATGTVTDRVTGLPIVGACVTYAFGEQEALAVTGDDGSYDLTDLPIGTHTRWADDCGAGTHLQDFAGEVELLGTEPEVYDFTLTPIDAPGAIFGVVSDAQAGTDLQGVCVQIDDTITLTTGAGGTFLVEGLAPGAHIVGLPSCPAQWAIYQPIEVEVVVLPGEQARIDISLVATQEVPVIEVANPHAGPDVPLVAPPRPPADLTLPATGSQSSLAAVGAGLVAAGTVLRRAGRRRGRVAGP